MENEQENQNRDSGGSWCGRDRGQGPTVDDMKEPALVLGVETGGSSFAIDEDVLQDDMELDALQITEKEWQRLENDAMISCQLKSATFIRDKDVEEGSQRGVILAPLRQHIYSLSERQARIEAYDEEKKRNTEWWARIQQLAKRKREMEEEVKAREIMHLKGVIKVAINRINLLQRGYRVAKKYPSRHRAAAAGMGSNKANNML
ncbi:hypothetical protein Q9L58_001485 [Maublancomyces gigas]|uniref:Uncharacterized protein n=1 Tax=Discina gigas TaxID=1032678 RepID=A0ABR3GU65_9PEZI